MVEACIYISEDYFLCYTYENVLNSEKKDVIQQTEKFLESVTYEIDKKKLCTSAGNTLHMRRGGMEILTGEGNRGQDEV